MLLILVLNSCADNMLLRIIVLFPMIQWIFIGKYTIGTIQMYEY